MIRGKSLLAYSSEWRYDMKNKRIGDESADVPSLFDKQAGLLFEYGNSLVTYDLTLMELYFIHGVVLLASVDSTFQNLPDASKAAVERFRAFCRKTWVEQGLTEEEALALDELREEISEEV